MFSLPKQLKIVFNQFRARDYIYIYTYIYKYICVKYVKVTATPGSETGNLSTAAGGRVERDF